MFKKSIIFLVIISILLFSGCFIRGRVVDENGAGVVGVTITLSDDDDPEKAEINMTTTTDSAGYYQFGSWDELLAIGSYDVVPSKTGYTFSPLAKAVEIEGIGEKKDIAGIVEGVDFVAFGDNNGSNDVIEVQLIGNYGEPAVYNPTEQQIADADITLSGSLSSLLISWKLQNVISVFVSGNSSIVYGIIGMSDGSVGQYTINSPVGYGDYSVPKTEITGQSPAPALIAGEYYNITVATIDGKSSYIGFSIPYQ